MILVLLVCLVIGGTNGARLKRMVGAGDIDITKAPYQVTIKYYDVHICGGSLISARHILTAAHCVFDLFEDPYEEVTVVTGTDNLKSGGTSHKVQNIEWHPEFVYGGDTFWNHDIAVITLANDVKEDEKQQAILLPIADVPNNVTGVVTGFGRKVTENPYLSNKLQAMKGKILTSNECKPFAIDNKILDNQICTKQPKGTGVCKGDSGSPLVYNGTLVGIVSWNRPDPCGSGIPDVYTNVYRYLNFIRNVVRGNCA